MDKRVDKAIGGIVYYLFAGAVALIVVFYYQRFLDQREFDNLGSRFTGEDMIWMLEHSNIEIQGDGIPGDSTPFRDYIRK